MMLDDFFTLSEINYGLAVPSRVKELVDALRKDRDSVVKNVGEAKRQWSAVATAIAATKNKDCLDLFIRLDGLDFISKWLKDVRMFSNDSSDSFLEELITHLLQALEKLPLDNEKLIAAEILTTVEDLLVHNSLKVKDKAQVLLENWKRKRDSDASLSDVEKFGALTHDEIGKSTNIERRSEHSESSQKDDSLSRETSCKEIGQETTKEDPVRSACTDAVNNGQVEKANNLGEASDPSIRNDDVSDHGSSPSVPKPAVGLPLCHSPVESCDPAISREDTLSQMEFNVLESACNTKHTPKIKSSRDKSGPVEEFNTSEERTFPASSNAGDAMKTVTESSSQKLYVTGNKNSSVECSLYIDSRKWNCDGKCSMDDHGSADEHKNSSTFSTEGGDYRKLGRSSSIEKKELEALQSGIEDRGERNKLDLHLRPDNLENGYKFAKKETGREADRVHKKSDVELYGIIDPLEVARKVAVEVEREIVGYRDQSCSSSEKLPEGVEQPGTPDSVTGKHSHASEGSQKEVPDGPELSAMQEESSTSTENLDAEQINGTQDMSTSQVTEAAQEECNTGRVPCNIDLNLEVCSEDADHHLNQFRGSVSIVSASRAAASPGLPVALLQFEGNLGWKGSAATSAFRPASPRRLRESEKDLFTRGSSGSSKQQERCLDIDLNATETIDGRTGDVSANKRISLYPGLPPGESSVETNARRSEYLDLDLDLNLASEHSVGPSDWRMGQQFFPRANAPQNEPHSSSSKQHSFKNLDLNGQPSFPSDSPLFLKKSQNFDVSGRIKSDDSAISIMGTRVEVSRQDVSPIPAIPNGPTSELMFGVNLDRAGSFLGMGSVLPYAHSSVYSYSNIASALAMPLSSAVYGSGEPIPYMDFRGEPVIPQMTGFSQIPFLTSMAGPNPSNGVGVVPSQSSLNLNSGMIAEGGSSEASGFFLNSGLVGSMDEQPRSNVKRKEPDNGWEQYPPRHYTPPWE